MVPWSHDCPPRLRSQASCRFTTFRRWRATRPRSTRYLQNHTKTSTFPRGNSTTRSQLEKKKPARKGVTFGDKVVYRKVLESDFHSLISQDGLTMLHQLGLDGFFNQPVPAFKLSLCDEFISTFTGETVSGTVRGKAILLTPRHVARATRLPCYAQDGDRTLLFEDSTIAAREHNMGHVVYGEDNGLVKEIETLLAVKLWCRSCGFKRAKQDVLLALDRSIRLGLQMNWAHHLCQLMVKSITKVAESSTESFVFPFGEWLSKIIEDQLDEVTVRVHAADGSAKVMRVNRDDARNAVKIWNSATDLDVEVVVRPKGSVTRRAAAGDEEEILQLRKRVCQLQERLEHGKELVSELLSTLEEKVSS